MTIKSVVLTKDEPTSKPTAAPKFPLRLKLSVMAAALTIIPLLTVGLILIDINVTEIEDRIRIFQIAIADDISGSIDDELELSQAMLMSIADGIGEIRGSEPEVGASLGKYSLPLIRAMIKQAESFDRITIYGLNGTFLSETSGALKPDKTPLSAELQAKLQKHPFDVSEVVLNGTEAVVLITVPYTFEDKIIGFIQAPVSLRNVDARVKRLAAVHFTKLIDPLFLVDMKGRVISYGESKTLKVMKSGPNIPLMDRLNPAAMRGGVSFSEEYTLDNGTEMVGSIIGMQQLKWAVIVQQPRDVVYGTLRKMRTAIILTVSVTILIALLVAFYIASRISAPIRKLARFARDLSERRFDARVEVHTQDELAVLGVAMSTAAMRLQQSEIRIKEEVAIRTDLGRYLPNELVDQVIKREADMGLGGQRREITVLFADVVAFTPLAEGQEPEAVVTILNELFSILTEIIFRYGGTVDKFVGDCVMAIWGAPKPQSDHAARAVSAAEEMLEWLEVGNAGWQKTYGVSLQLAIGMNSGMAIVGNVGSSTRMEYTAIGDVVNVAARLETIARPMQILVTKETVDTAGSGFEYRSLGPQEMVGRAQSVELYEVVI